jgi:hypothetical protein
MVTRFHFAVVLVITQYGFNNEVVSFSPTPQYDPMIVSSKLRSTLLKPFQRKLYTTKSVMLLRSNSENTKTDSENNNNNNNFLQDIFQSAFANDRELLSKSNKRIGMLDEGIDGDDDAFLLIQPQTQKSIPELTPIQQAWRQKMMSSSSSLSQMIETTDLIGSTIGIDLYLSGVPNKDPSNDLYASKTNISLRDRSVGQVLPSLPTISNVYIEFLSNNKCSVSTTLLSSSSLSNDDDTPNIDTDSTTTSLDVTTSTNNNHNFVNTNMIGDWKLSEDGKQIRFRINVYGYQRTIQTKGTIQKIYWSQETNDSITETSTLYTIPEGWLYFETELLKRPNGSIQWMNSISSSIASITNLPTTKTRSSITSSSNGIIKIEQSTGMFGIASKMVPCGKFIVVSAS